MPRGHDYPVHELRQRLGMRQQDFAQAVGVSVATVSLWERGRSKPSRLAIDKMEMLARREERRQQRAKKAAA